MKINPYLNFNGTAEEAFNFYKLVFGGEFVNVMRFGDAPGCEGMPAADKNKIMHIALPVGEGNILMASDAVGGGAPEFVDGNNYHIAISPDSYDEASRLFNSLSEGGIIIVPFAKSFWGADFGMAKDKFGVSWMISYDENLPK